MELSIWFDLLRSVIWKPIGFIHAITLVLLFSLFSCGEQEIDIVGDGTGTTLRTIYSDTIIPQNVTAEAGTNYVTISWDAVAGADSYNIYWSTSAGVTKDTGTKVENVLFPYVHTSISISEVITSYYIVTSVIEQSESAASDEVSSASYVRVFIPQNVSATAGDGEVTISWDAVEGADSYNIYWSTSAGVTKDTGTKITNITETSYIHTDLVGGTTYHYKITAVIGLLESISSSEASVRVSFSYSYLFDDGLLQGWTADGSWGVTTEDSYSGSYSVTDSPNGDYSNNADMSLTSPILDFSGATGLTLSFYHHYSVHTASDYCYVYVSSDGGATFTNLTNYTWSSSTTFTQETFDLSSYVSSQVVIKFRFYSGGILSDVHDGWYIDDIEITEASSQ